MARTKAMRRILVSGFAVAALAVGLTPSAQAANSSVRVNGKGETGHGGQVAYIDGAYSCHAGHQDATMSVTLSQGRSQESRRVDVTCGRNGKWSQGFKKGRGVWQKGQAKVEIIMVYGHRDIARTNGTVTLT